MPICTACNLEKPVVEFAPNKSRKSGTQSRCKLCYAIYQRDYYRNRSKVDVEYRDRQAATRRRNRQRLASENHQKLWEYFESHPCLDCGEDDPVVLEFDHKKDKMFNIGSARSWKPWSAILEEIEKCEVVCSNCHTRRTAKQFGWYTYK